MLYQCDRVTDGNHFARFSLFLTSNQICGVLHKKKFIVTSSHSKNRNCDSVVPDQVEFKIFFLSKSKDF